MTQQPKTASELATEWASTLETADRLLDSLIAALTDTERTVFFYVRKRTGYGDGVETSALCTRFQLTEDEVNRITSTLQGYGLVIYYDARYAYGWYATEAAE